MGTTGASTCHGSFAHQEQGARQKLPWGFGPSSQRQMSLGEHQLNFSFDFVCCARYTSHQSKKEIPEVSFNSMLRIFIEHVSARRCFCIWPRWQIRDEGHR